MQSFANINGLEVLEDWRLWCRLCAKDDPEGNVDVFIEEEQWQLGDNDNDKTNLLDAIEKHFSIKISHNEELSQMLCTECLSMITLLVNFSKRVSIVQQMFEVLQYSLDSTNLDFHNIRFKYGIYDAPPAPILVNQPATTEVLYIKPKSRQIRKCTSEKVDVNSSNPLELQQGDVEIKAENAPTKSNNGNFATINIRNCERLFDNVNDKNEQETKCLKRKYRSTEKEEQVENDDGMKDKLKIRTPAKNFKCAQCSRAFPNRLRLERHVKTHVAVELRRCIPCPYCDKKFVGELSVQMHIKYLHMKDRPFICEECGFAVKTKSVLSDHMLTHTSDTPFKCEVCKTGFKNRRRLNRHAKTHDAETYSCSECGKQLKTRDTLTRHLLVHSDEAQHNCDYCGRAFKRAKALKTHLIAHTGMKPYSCNFCDRSFSAGQNCSSHMKNAHPHEFAALKANGLGEMYTLVNMPKLEALKAVAKSSKESGFFDSTRKTKPQDKETY